MIRDTLHRLTLNATLEHEDEEQIPGAEPSGQETDGT